MTYKKFLLVLNNNGICISKKINFTNVDVFGNEIEITEEQFNQITEFPVRLTIESNKVVSWEKTVLPESEPFVQEPTPEERITALEMALLEVL